MINFSQPNFEPITNAVRRYDSAPWRNRMSPKDILNLPYPSWNPKDDTRDIRVIPLNDAHACEQFGRSVPHLQHWVFVAEVDGWTEMLHQYATDGFTSVRVKTRNGHALVQHAREGEAKWQTHYMQRTLRVWENLPNAAERVTFVGGTEGDHRLWKDINGKKNYDVRPIFEAAGGTYDFGVRAWKFACAKEELPTTIKELVATPYRCKYHYLAAILRFQVVVEEWDNSPFDFISSGAAALRDGYIRESWRVAGFSYTDIPRPLFPTIGKDEFDVWLGVYTESLTPDAVSDWLADRRADMAGYAAQLAEEVVLAQSEKDHQARVSDAENTANNVFDCLKGEVSDEDYRAKRDSYVEELMGAHLYKFTREPACLSKRGVGAK